MTKKKTSLSKKSVKLRFAFLRLVKRTLKKVPVMVWATFALIGSFLIGLILGIGYLDNTPPEKTPYQIELGKNVKYQNLISGYEDLSKLYSSQSANLAITFDRDMIENHQDQVNAAILRIDEYRDKILVERGRIDELRHSAGLPPENLKSK